MKRIIAFAACAVIVAGSFVVGHVTAQCTRRTCDPFILDGLRSWAARQPDPRLARRAAWEYLYQLAGHAADDAADVCRFAGEDEFSRLKCAAARGLNRVLVDTARDVLEPGD